jgi:hypothetical protein
MFLLSRVANSSERENPDPCCHFVFFEELATTAVNHFESITAAVNHLESIDEQPCRIFDRILNRQFSFLPTSTRVIFRG